MGARLRIRGALFAIGQHRLASFRRPLQPDYRAIEGNTERVGERLADDGEGIASPGSHPPRYRISERKRR